MKRREVAEKRRRAVRAYVRYRVSRRTREASDIGPLKSRVTTVKLAAGLVVEPRAFVTATSKFPALTLVTLATVKVERVAPAMAVPFLRHWKVGAKRHSLHAQGEGTAGGDGRLAGKMVSTGAARTVTWAAAEAVPADSRGRRVACRVGEVRLAKVSTALVAPGLPCRLSATDTKVKVCRWRDL